MMIIIVIIMMIIILMFIHLHVLLLLFGCNSNNHSNNDDDDDCYCYYLFTKKMYTANTQVISTGVIAMWTRLTPWSDGRASLSWMTPAVLLCNIASWPGGKVSASTVADTGIEPRFSQWSHTNGRNVGTVAAALPGTWGRYRGGRRPSSDDSFHSPTVIPPSALDKPSIMKRYHRRRTSSPTSHRRSPTIVMFHDTRFVECRWWNDGWTVSSLDGRRPP